jgi:hydrogenase maturation factor HypF (carbamoyltransferase family)
MWWWKLKKLCYNAIWKQIVLTKYNNNTSSTNMSYVWRNIMVLHQLGQTDSCVIIGNDKHTEFCTDKWIGKCALMSSYFHFISIVH